MRIFKYLGRHAGAVLLIFVLLFGQAFCDLMLPNYTSQIVDVGIQQAGVEHVATERLTARTHDEIAVMIGQGAEGEVGATPAAAPGGTAEASSSGPAEATSSEFFQIAYTQVEDGSYELTQIGASNRDALD